MVAMTCALFMIPIVPGTQADVRGFTEMFPLNGPCWSLFFEYIGNLLYALFLHRLPTKALAFVAALSGLLLLTATIQQGSIDFGWSMAGGGFWQGLARMLFPYSMGMLMARLFRPIQVRGGFRKCGLAILAVGCVPILGSGGTQWVNGLFNGLCILIVFPALVWMGASAVETGRLTSRVCRLLGDVSYPLYATHYPFMYLFYRAIGFHGDAVPISVFSDTWPWALAIFLGCPLLAYALFRWYDMPVRRWLTAARGVKE